MVCACDEVLLGIHLFVFCVFILPGLEAGSSIGKWPCFLEYIIAETIFWYVWNLVTLYYFCLKLKYMYMVVSRSIVLTMGNLDWSMYKMQISYFLDQHLTGLSLSALQVSVLFSPKGLYGIDVLMWTDT